jgi:hypothetical protein
MFTIDKDLTMNVLTRHDWLYVIFLFSAVVVFGNGIHYMVFRFLRRGQAAALRRGLGLRKYLALPARTVFLTIGFLIILPAVPKIPAILRGQIEQITESLLVLFLGWLAIGGVYVFQAFTLSRFDTTVPDNLRARRVHTQMQFIRRILILIVVLLDAGALLWSLHDERLWEVRHGAAGIRWTGFTGAGRGGQVHRIELHCRFADRPQRAHPH